MNKTSSAAPVFGADVKRLPLKELAKRIGAPELSPPQQCWVQTMVTT